MLVVGLAGAVALSVALARTVRADGLGVRPGPRSHAPEDAS